MENLLKGIPGVTVYLDDVLIMGANGRESLRLPCKMCCVESASRLRLDMCVLMDPSVVYLGHQVDAQGLHPIA